MDRDPGVGYVTSVEERRLLREKKKRRKRIRNFSILGACLLLAVAAFLFSPAGPFGQFLFPGSEEHASLEAEEGQGAAEAKSTPHLAAHEANPEIERERKEKPSNPAPPAVAIVVDDVGNSPENLPQWLSIDAPLTFSTMPYCAASFDLAERLYQAGQRIMLHIPTENEPPHSFSGKGQLSVGMSRENVFATLDADLATVPHVTGINNHQGGRGCNDLQLMTYQCLWAQERGLFVVDSDSSAHSQVTKAATGLGMPRRRNQVFIDHDNNPDYIRSAMRRLADIARSNGTAIGICHFHRPNTPRTVGEMIKTLQAEGIHFAFVQDITN